MSNLSGAGHVLPEESGVPRCQGGSGQTLDPAVEEERLVHHPQGTYQPLQILSTMMGINGGMGNRDPRTASKQVQVLTNCLGTCHMKPVEFSLVREAPSGRPSTYHPGSGKFAHRAAVESSNMFGLS